MVYVRLTLCNPNLAAEIKTDQTRHFFLIFCWTFLVNPCELCSAALAHLLKVSTCCAFRDALEFNKWVFELRIFSYQLKAVCPFFSGVSNKLTGCNVVSKGKVIKSLILRNCLTKTRYWLIWVWKWQRSKTLWWMPNFLTSFVPEMQCMHGLSHRSSAGAYTHCLQSKHLSRKGSVSCLALQELWERKLPIILNLNWQQPLQISN